MGDVVCKHCGNKIPKNIPIVRYNKKVIICLTVRD